MIIINNKIVLNEQIVLTEIVVKNVNNKT